MPSDPSEPTLSPTAVHDERLNDIRLSHNTIPIERQQAWLDAGWLAMKAVFSAAACGNVQCQQAQRDILALLK